MNVGRCPSCGVPLALFVEVSVPAELEDALADPLAPVLRRLEAEQHTPTPPPPEPGQPAPSWPDAMP